jgi:hypothetical protein
MLRQTLQHALVPVKSSTGTPMGTGDWLQLEYLVYEDNKDIERKWERCTRKKAQPSDIDGKECLNQLSPTHHL